MSVAVASQLVAGVVRELRFVERALLADEPALACSHLTTAADLLRAAQGSVAATAALRELAPAPESLHWRLASAPAGK